MPHLDPTHVRNTATATQQQTSTIRNREGQSLPTPLQTHSAYNCLTVIHLLSCVSKKQRVAAPARDLYTSAWFRKARSFAESTEYPWFVLSAKHGLVHPDEVIAPYDLTLNSMPAPARRQWASRTLAQLEPHLQGVESVVFLAGQRYREFLEAPLRDRGLVVSVPMEGLRIGEQLRWLTRRLDD